MKILWLGWKEMSSTRRLLEVSPRLGVTVDAIEILDVNFATEGEALAEALGEPLPGEYDALVVRTFHPYVSEALTLAKLFRDAGRVVVDESLTDEGYAISKMHDYLRLAAEGLAVPRTWQVYDPAEVERLASGLGYPCILKGVHGRQGTHVYRIEDANQLRRRLRRYPSGELLLQEYLRANEDFRLLVLGYEALPAVVKRRPEPGDFRTNLATRAEFRSYPAEEYPELVALAEAGARLLRREFAGVDVRYREDVPMILEVNRQPSFEGFEEATGINVPEAFLRYLLKKTRRNGP